MAITIVGTAPVTSFGNNGNDATANLSGLSLQENDVVIVTAAAPRVTGNTPAVVTAGYTECVTPHLGSAANRPSIGVWWKRMGATPDGDVQVSGDGSSQTDTTVIAIGLRGVLESGDILDQTSTTAGETNSTNPDPASIVTQTVNAWVLVFANMAVTTDTAIDPPSGYGNQAVVAGSDTVDHTHAMATREVASPTTENPASWTNWNTGYWYAITVAIKPQPTATVLTVDDAYVTSQIDTFSTTKSDTLVVADGYSESQSDLALITKSDTLALLDTYVDTQVDGGLSLAAPTELEIDNAFVTTQTDNIDFPQVLRPSADVVDGNWTNELGNNTNLYDSVKETPPDDGNWIESEWSPSSSVCVLKLSAGDDPGIDTGHILRFRIEKYPPGSESISITLQLREGYVNEGNQGTLIAEWQDSDLSDAIALITRDLSTGEAGTITDRADLYVRMVAG